MTLNSVVLPAPFGPMMALRSPGMIWSLTSRTACRPSKLLHRLFNSRTGTLPIEPLSLFTLAILCPVGRFAGALVTEPRRLFSLFAELAGREVAVVNRLREELLLAVGPELADLRIGLDHGVPELVLVVAEHLLLLDLLDVDVLDRVAHVVEFDRTTRSVELDALHDLDERFRTGIFAAGLLYRLVEPHGGGVVVFRVVAGDLVGFGAVRLDEGLVRRSSDCRAVVQRGDVTYYFVAHERQREFVIAGAAADDRLFVAGRAQLLRKLQRHRPHHQREHRVDVALDGRDVRPEILGAKRGPDLLDYLAAAVLERLLETADRFVAEGIVGADRDDLLVALLAGPLAERMCRQ